MTVGLQKYRADISRRQSDGAIRWYAEWVGGPSLARINNCRLHGIAGNMRRTVYVTGAPDTWFSIPAVTTIMGCKVRGYITTENDCDTELVFRHCYY